MSDNISVRPVTRLIDGARFGGLHTTVVVLATVVILLAGVDNISIGIIGTAMAATIHTTVPSMAGVYSAGEVGFLAGALIFGPVADRVGRKPILIATVVLFAVFTLLTPLGTTVGAIIVFRLVTGIGLGGAIPVALSLVTEYMPARIRSGLTSVAWAGFPAGGVVVGIAAGIVLPHGGWELLYVMIGSASLAVAVLLVALMPESLDFMLRSGAPERRVDRVVRRLRRGSDVPVTTDTLLTVEANPALVEFPETVQSKATVRYLFTERRALRTVLLWCAFGCTFVPVVFVGDWGPALLQASGLGIGLVGLSITCNSIGSMIGSAIIGRLMSALGDYKVLLGALGCACVAFIVFGLSLGSFAGIAVAITAVGFFSGGAQSGVITFAALLYPNSLRATGLGWAVSAGRAVAATAPLLGAATIGAGWPPAASIALIGGFPLVGLVVVLLIRGLVAARAERIALQSA
ncbi:MULTISPECIES: MFS transporter [unclassified Curtobacterium]|uniref:MFS transporter n=1 Tax=unclassified Curtobacterium TaxID=257496 RepID=UPI0038052819